MSDPDSKITTQELTRMFGNSMPVEAFRLLITWQGSQADLREALRYYMPGPAGRYIRDVRVVEKAEEVVKMTVPPVPTIREALERAEWWLSTHPQGKVMADVCRAALAAAPHPASDALGKWLSAALDDPEVCSEMKADIEAWFAAGQPVWVGVDMAAPPPRAVDVEELFSDVSADDLPSKIAAEIMGLKWAHGGTELEHFARHGELQELVAKCLAPPPPAVDAHEDDKAADEFAAAMKAKLKFAREHRGRGGWERMRPEELSRMLREHVEKGDPVDVGNFCMMLHQHRAQITPPPAAVDVGETEGSYVLIKRGLYWRPDDLGYTGLLSEAGHYTKFEAEQRANDDVTMVPLTEAPEFAPSCFDDIKVREMSRDRDRLRARAEKAEAALRPFADAAASLSDRWLDHETHWYQEGRQITVGELRAARAALSAEGGK